MLYRLDRLDSLVIRRFEVVNETPNYLDIQPRGVNNREAMKNTQRIKKNLLGQEYFWSAEEALSFYVRTRLAIIKRAKRSIELASMEIAEARKCLNTTQR